MSQIRLSLSVFGLTMIMVLTTGCGGSSAVQPQPGATFSGPMELSASGVGSNVTVNGGEIEFTVANDGSGVVSSTYSLKNALCVNEQKNTRVSGGSNYLVSKNPPVPIVKGKFEFEAGDYIIKGDFTSETEANGTIEIYSFEMETLNTGNYFTCDFGTWNWSASVK
jgi:hypothetical protein